jgi:signal transduction histidine kinase
MRVKVFVIGSAILLMIILLFITFYQINETQEEIIKLYGQKQATLANQAAISLSSYIEERIKAIEVLADFPASRKLEQHIFITEYERTFKKVQGFEYIIYLNQQSSSIVGYPENFPGPSKQVPAFNDLFKKTFDIAVMHRHTEVFSKNVLVEGKVFVCIIAPIFSFEDKFQGAILGVLNVKTSIQEALKPVVEGKNIYAWLLNDKGFLVYHPQHEGMLLNNIFQPSAKCFDCHQNFDLENDIVRNGHGVGIKSNNKTDRQLIAYAKIPLRNTNWYVAISGPYLMVTESINRLSGKFIVLVLLMIGSILLGAYVINRINSKLITARERRRQEQLVMVGEMSTRIAHEIKNPLASIQTGIQVLENRMESSSRDKTYFKRLRAEIQRVDEILKGLLAFAKSDTLKTKTTSISPLIKRFQHIIMPHMETKCLKFLVQIDKNLPAVNIDEQKIEQVLWNLTLNAIQASPENSTICLACAAIKNSLQISISDEGIGIDEKDLPKIIQPFYSTKTQGSGLGLAISKKIIEMHNGTFSIKSKPSKGTKVIIILSGVTGKL